MNVLVDVVVTWPSVMIQLLPVKAVGRFKVNNAGEIHRIVGIVIKNRNDPTEILSVGRLGK